MSKKRADLLLEIHQTSLLTQRLLHSRMHQFKQDDELSPAQIRVIHILKHIQPVSFKALASKMLLTPGAISQFLDPLLKNGYVKRSQDENDRRVSYIALTDKGNQKAEKLSENFRTIHTEALSTLSTEELTELLGIQRKMLTYLEDHTESANSPEKLNN
jgi:DNA-binding MarR family transcriptional regulator